MSRDTVIDLAVHALAVGARIALPLLAVSLIVGLVISIFQAVTQIQEMTLTFIPKLIAAGIVLVIAGPWMLDQLVTYTSELYRSIPSLAGSG
jgi:flagellar biosynthetic protein FliQ